MWLNRLRIWHSHCSGLGHCYSMDSIPGPRSFPHAMGEAKKKKNLKSIHKGNEKGIRIVHVPMHTHLQILIACFSEMEKLILKFIWNSKGLKIATTL